MTNLSAIYNKLQKGELPQAGGVWLPENSSNIDEAIELLSQMTLAAAAVPDHRQKETVRRLEIIDQIEALASDLTHRTVKLSSAKGTLIDQIAERALKNLEGSQRFAKSPKQMKSVLGGWNEILRQRQGSNDPVSEKVQRLELKLKDIFYDSYQNHFLIDKLREVANNSLFSKVGNYLSAFEKLKTALGKRDKAALRAFIEAPEFPLTTAVDSQGNTLLHILAESYELRDLADLLVEKCPSAVDIPNDEFKLPFTDSGRWLDDEEKYKHLKVVFREKEKGLRSFVRNQEWIAQHPNQVMRWLHSEIQEGTKDTEVCELLRACRSVIVGQRGKNLLYAAIQSGHPMIVKQLLDLGVPLNEVYGQPLSSRSRDMRISESLPLQQAIRLGYVDIVDLLLKSEASIYTPNGKGDAAIELVIKSKTYDQDHAYRSLFGYAFPSLEICRLMEVYVVPSELKLYQQMLFNQAIETSNWPMVTQFIREGWTPPSDVSPWAIKALKQGQYDLVTMLVEKGYLKKVTPVALASVVEYGPLAWADWFLGRMVKNGMNLNDPVIKEMAAPQTATPDKKTPEKIETSLLKIAIEKRNYPLAAILVSLGANVKDAGTDAQALIDYSTKLKQGSLAEQSLRKLLNATNIAHLVGDPIIEKMKGDDGKVMEGSISSESIAFFNASLDFVEQEHPDLSVGPLSHLRLTMHKAQKLAIKLESMQHLEDDVTIATAIKQLESELLEEIDQLKVGESIVIPLGWHSGDQGHAILIECKRLSHDQVEINVINTGAGAQFHGVADDQSRMHLNTIRRHLLSTEQLRKIHLLRALIEPKVATTNRRRYFAEDLYGALERFRVSENPISDANQLLRNTRKTQLSGTCSFRCLLAYAKLSLEPAQYKRIKHMLTKEVMELALGQHGPLLPRQPQFAKLLSLAAPRIFHTYIKRLSDAGILVELEKQKLMELLALKKNLQEAVPKAFSENKKIPLGESFPIQSTARRKPWLQSAIDTVVPLWQSMSDLVRSWLRREKAPTIRTIPHIDITQVSSVKDLEKHLKNVSAFLETQTDTQFVSQYLRSMILPLGRCFLANAPKSPLARTISDLKKDPKACERFITEIDSLATKHAYAQYKDLWKSGEYRSNMGDFVALQYALIMARELSIAIEENENIGGGGRIRDYGMTMFSVDSLDRNLRTVTTLDPEIEEDLRQITAYANQNQKEDASQNLFDFQKQQFPTHAIPGFSLKLNKKGATGQRAYAPDYAYAKAHAQTREDWREADAIYNELLKKQAQEQGALPDIDIEEWRIHWLYVNDLPPYFDHLRRLAFLSWMIPPGYQPTLALAEADKRPALALELDEAGPRTRDNKAVAYPVMHYVDSNGFRIHQRSGNEYENLPKDAGGLQKFFNSSGKKTCLELLAYGGQSGAVLSAPNILNRELMGIRCGVSTYQTAFYSPLAVPLLLDFFGPQHVSELGKAERRAFFEATLFASLRLPMAIRELPACGQDLKLFFENTTNYFEDLIATSVEVTASTETVAFLATQWMRALVYLEKEGIDAIENKRTIDLLEEARLKIRQLLSDPKFQNDDIQQSLNLALVYSYHGTASPKDLTRDCILGLASYWKSIQGDQTSKKLFPAFVETATSTPLQSQDVIQQTLKDDPDFARSVLGSVAQLYKIAIPQGAPWQCTHFPVYSCRTRDGLVEIHVLTGRFLLNKQELMALPERMRKASPSYQELFGENKLDIMDCVTHFQAQDAFGKIQIVLKPKREHESREIASICREFDKQWYTHIPAKESQKHPDLPALVSRKGLTLWSSSDKPLHYLYVDPKTWKPVIRLDADQRITLLDLDPMQRWEWVDAKTVSEQTDLHALDGDAFILQAEMKKVPRRMLMQLPHLTDEAGNTLEFERRWVDKLKEPRWVLRNRPHLMLAKEQRLPGPRRFDNFLILENVAGQRSALIPMKTKEQLNAKETVAVSCIHVNIREGALTTTDPAANAYLAYLMLTYATTPEDYQLALSFLKKARKFERYTTEELRLLGLLYRSHKVTNDHSGTADAVRLYCHWLVTENFQRNPSKPLEVAEKDKKIFLSEKSPAEHWQRYWEESFPDESPMIHRQELLEHYVARQSILPHGMRIQDNLSPQELMDWNLTIGASASGLRAEAPLPAIRVSLNDIEILNKMSDSKHTPRIPLPGRPNQETLGSEFQALLQAARSGDPKRRQLAEEQCKAMRYDNDRQAFSLILAAELASEENIAAKAVMQSVFTIQNTEFQFGESWAQQRKLSLAQDLQQKLIAFAPFTYKLPYDASPPPAVMPVEVLPLPMPVVLPEKPPTGNPLTFITSHTSMDIPRFQRLFKKGFERLPSDGREPIEPFTFETDDPWLEKSIEELNADYLAGAAKNQAVPRYGLAENQTIENLLTVQRKAIASQAKHYSDGVLKTQEEQILEIGNRPPADPVEALKYQAEVASGRKKSLNIRDCVGLFLQGDVEGYRRLTHLQSEEEIAAFHNSIGDYILYHNKVNRYRQVIKAFDRLEKVYQSPHSPEQLQSALQRLAEELNTSTDSLDRLQKLKAAGDTEKDPAALLVFEYVLNLSLKEHQVEGIRDMTQAVDDQKARFRSVLLQRIQGGGKSLVFGHIMAFLKADGYHLSIHVPTTPQYQTSLYDMRERSEQLFGQREHTIVFDDDPLKFTPKYLTWMKRMLEESIVNRDYVTMTNETLRAMRCKYLKTRFEIMKAAPGADIAKMEESNQILKEILQLMRQRGVFTFDEMHKAFDPLKELNMPYGQPERPNREESQLIGDVLRFACLATDRQGDFLLDLAHSAQLTEEQMTALKGSIVEELIKQPVWNNPGIKAYLSGETNDIPAFLEQVEHKQLRPLVILARQLLVGKWLQERLSLNVNEHHGLPKTGFPLVSIPFIANMKPAYGSEFSDRYVMTTNTLIAYLSTGLNEYQTKELIESCRQKADAQKSKMKETTPNCSVRDTQISKDFKAGTGIDLYSIDLEKAEDIQKAQKALLSRTSGAIQLLIDYVNEREIGEVELYENQVCSNGQNVASMCQSFVAYSASMENPNMAPLGSDTKPEEGTNGQTIDLLIQQKTEVHLVDDSVGSLFAMMQASPQRKNIHAIIDVGAYFRGMDNEAVAKLICTFLKETKSEIQGVLFFNGMTDSLCFMQRDPPYTIKILSGTTPETIESETGFEMRQLFTYYDQDHMTGVDIAQDEESVGVMTMSRHTKIHEDLQGSRRLRQLDFLQRILVALPKSAVGHVGETLHTTFGSQEVPTIKQLLLFAHIKERWGQKGENLLFAMQKLENVIQQHILDKLYVLGKEEERALFGKTSYLFEKSVAIDLIKEYAHQRKPVDIDVYFKAIEDTLLEPLKTVLSPIELQELRTLIDKQILTDDAFAGMQPTMDVHAGFAPDRMEHPLSVQNRETSRVQAQQQERVSEKLEVKEQESLNEFLSQVESRRQGARETRVDVDFTKEVFFSESFGAAANTVDVTPAREALCWDLNAALKIQMASSTLATSFDEGLLVTNNAAMVREKFIDLIGPYRKKPWPVIVICDEEPDGAKTWKVMLGSIADGVNFQCLLNLKDTKGIEGRTMWLTRANGKVMAGPRDLELDSDPKLARLMTQALFFAGEFETLSYNPWRTRLESWIGTMNTEERDEWVRFFDQEVLMGNPPGYQACPLYTYLHQ